MSSATNKRLIQHMMRDMERADAEQRLDEKLRPIIIDRIIAAHAYIGAAFAKKWHEDSDGLGKRATVSVETVEKYLSRSRSLKQASENPMHVTTLATRGRDWDSAEYDARFFPPLDRRVDEATLEARALAGACIEAMFGFGAEVILPFDVWRQFALGNRQVMITMQGNDYVFATVSTDAVERNLQ